MIQDDRQTPLPADSAASNVPTGVYPLPSCWVIPLAWLFGGVLMPFFCFLIAYPEGPSWQSGQWQAYAQLLLARKPSLVQYPFLLYSMTCMVLLVYYPARFWNSTFVRLGIFTGVLLAAEYWLVFQFAFSGSTHIVWAVTLSVLAVLLPWAVWQICRFLVRKFGSSILWVFALPVVALLVVFSPWLVFGVLVICVWCSTPWALASYLAVSIYLVRGTGARFRFSLAQLLLALGWLSAHLAAWRISFLVMLSEYASLPTSPPAGCFICTAVAKGHARVVRSEQYVAPNGTVFRVNDQLRHLKAFELLMGSVSPGFHRSCRRVYDQVAPNLAAAVVHPLLADLGYLMLKPAEWVALACLALAIPGEMTLVHRLYRESAIMESQPYRVPEQTDSIDSWSRPL